MMRMQEEEESILEYGNYTNYYVQSPSSVVYHARDSEPLYHNNKPLLNLDSSAPGPGGMSRCSSSRASSTSLLHENHKGAPMSIDHDNDNNAGTKNCDVLVPDNNIGLKKLGKVFYEDLEGEEGLFNDYNDNDGGNCWQFFSFYTYDSPVWIALQLLWRFLLSVMVALLVFYLVTKPPAPKISLKVTRVNQFELPEGVDLTGVATNFLNCNISMGLIIDNKSKVFGLHVLSPVVEIYFGRVPLVLSQGPRMYVKSREWRNMEIYIGTNKKAMYGAGRSMEEMFDSGKGLPLFITLNFNSFYRIVPHLIQSDFHHYAHCLLFLQNFYDEKHHTQAYNTTCFVSS